METERAIKIAELWEAGKMIGGDEDEVRNALLHEVRRLRNAIDQAPIETRNMPNGETVQVALVLVPNGAELRGPPRGSDTPKAWESP